MTLTLDFEKHFPHPPAKVWRALVTPEALAQWLMPNDFEPVIGRTARFTYPRGDCGAEDGVVLVEVEELDPPARMVWRWQNADLGETTRVVFSLEASGDGTRLRLSHSGIPTEQEARSLGSGWPGKLESLGHVLQN